MKNICNGCGKCCETIVLNYSIQDLKDNYKGNSDAEFMIENWVAISQDEVYKINPWIEAMGKKAEEDGRTYSLGKKHYYTCKQYDKTNKNCKVHNTTKPKVCSEFPFYGRAKLPKGYFMYDENCSYNKPEFFEDNNKIKK